MKKGRCPLPLSIGSAQVSGYERPCARRAAMVEASTTLWGVLAVVYQNVGGPPSVGVGEVEPRTSFLARTKENPFIRECASDLVTCLAKDSLA